MARKKVKLEYIENDSSRRVTYKKRVKGIVKKTQELSVLCGVDACTIIYGPYDQAPVVWPSSEVEAKRIISNFKRKPEVDQSQRRFNQETFLKQSVIKAEERLLKLQRKNREIEMENVISDILLGKPIQQVALEVFDDLIWVIDDKLRTIQHRIRVTGGGDNNNNNNNNNNNPPPNVNVPSHDVGTSRASPNQGDDCEMMEGINDVMDHTPTRQMQAGLSQNLYG